MSPAINGHEVAIWAGAVSFFGSVLAIGAFNLLNINGWLELLASIIVAGFTAGAVYSRERLSDAKRKERA